MSQSSNGIRLLRAGRPRQAAKNLLVFTAVVLSAGIAWQPQHPGSWLPLVARSLVAFVAFCAVAAGGYLINDIRDLAHDRVHPVKCGRPLASEELSIPEAYALATSSLVLGLVVALALGPLLLLWVALYVACTLAYSFLLKRVALLDILIIGVGFVIRVAAGAAATHLSVSTWMYLFVLACALTACVSKRRGCERLAGSRYAEMTRWPTFYAGRGGTITYWLTFFSVLLCYSAYAAFSADAPPNHALLLTVPIVALALGRFGQLERRGDDAEHPVDRLIADPLLAASALVWAPLCVAILAWSR